MCGRVAQFYSWKELQRAVSVATPPGEPECRYNLAPLQLAIVLRAGPEGLTATRLRWGLVPSWADDVSRAGSLINARAETIDSKPAFRAAFRARRCIVPISGFFEWGATPGVGLFGQRASPARGAKKRPYYIDAANGELLLLAGLWESWTSPDGTILETFTIITTTPNERVGELHDRMPVILDPAEARRWIEGPADGEAGVLLEMLRPSPSERVRIRPVSPLVNSPRFDDARCIEPASG